MTRFEREWEDQTRPIDRVSTDTGRQLDRLRQGRCDRYLLRELRETDSWLRRCKAYIRIFIDLSLLALTLTRLQPWLNTWHYTFIQISIFNGIGIEQARDSRLDSRTGWELLKEMAHREVALFTERRFVDRWPVEQPSRWPRQMRAEHLHLCVCCRPFALFRLNIRIFISLCIFPYQRAWRGLPLH